MQEHMASTVLQFGAQPSHSLPALIGSFAHPVHVDESLFETDSDPVVENGSEGQEIVAIQPTLGVGSSRGSLTAENQPIATGKFADASV